VHELDVDANALQGRVIRAGKRRFARLALASDAPSEGGRGPRPAP
jgi:hypothetical protein